MTRTRLYSVGYYYDGCLHLFVKHGTTSQGIYHLFSCIISHGLTALHRHGSFRRFISSHRLFLRENEYQDIDFNSLSLIQRGV